MNLYGLQNAASSKITVTATATLLKALIDTAGSVSHVFPGGLSGIDLVVEDGDVRILFDGNTPTASNGILLLEGTTHHFRNVDFHKARLIRTGASNVACSVQIGFAESDEVTNSAGGGGAGSSGGEVTGNVASGAADSGNPVKTGGVYNSTLPTFTNGQRGDLQIGARGSTNVQLMQADGTTAIAAAATNADAQAASSSSSRLEVLARLTGFNGSTFDRLRTAVVAATATLTGFLNTLPWAVFNTTPTTRTNGQGGPLEADASGNLRTTLATTIAGEDLAQNRLRVEERYTVQHVTADTLVNTGAGVLHTLTFACTDAAPTAGSIIVYANTAESGTILFSATFTTTWFAPFTVTIDGIFATGLYVGFTTTNDVGVTVSYRADV
jgi:hypothetical protein